ncbi:MAG TPA: lasso peptide biosynthesis B2 protein [Thermoleophilaceae bacterium]|jgi:hypothetical protein
MDRLQPGLAIRHAEVEGLRVVLDLRTESYLVLDRVASAMWAALTASDDRAGALAELEDRFDADRERLAADLDAFATRCVERGLLDSAGSRRPGAPVRPAPAERRRGEGAARAPTGRRRRGSAWLTTRALQSLTATHLALSRRGFRSAYEDAERLPVPAGDSDLVEPAVGAFVRAEELFLARRAPDDCLLRSLALHRFLRGVGLPSEHVIGVRRVPFQAHAWVEHGGEALLDRRPHRTTFTPLARLAATDAPGRVPDDPVPARAAVPESGTTASD